MRVLTAAVLACATVLTTSLCFAGNHQEGTNYALDASLSGDCKAGSVCTGVVKITISGEWHINDSYKYKLTAIETPGIEFFGRDDTKRQFFGLGSGGEDFSKSGEKSGVLTFKFKPAKAGSVKVAGKMKVALCSKETCTLDAPEVSFTFNVK